MQKRVWLQWMIVLAILLLVQELSAQNVGIGTITPSSKLTIAGNESTGNGENASLKLQNLNSGNAWYIRAGATGTATPNGGLSIADNAGYRLAITNNGFVGIGLLSPSEMLHVNGNIQLDNALKGIIQNGADAAMITRGFDLFTTGKHTGLGRWGVFMEPNVLTIGIPNVNGKRMAVSSFNANSSVANELLVVAQNGNVGINESNPLWTLDLNGSMQLKGRLYTGGSSGTAGQVLTSGGGALAPSWQTLSQPYDTKIRFAASFSQSATTNDYCVFSTTARYNLSPVNAVISAGGIQVATAGLYHFDVFVRATYNFASAPASGPVFTFQLYNGLANPFPFVNSVPMPSSANNTASSNFVFTDKYSLDIQVGAGEQIKLHHGFGLGGGTSYTVSGYIAGYLISE